MIKFTIIIPTYNRIDFVTLALESCIEFVGGAIDSYEIIVIDDCSSDGTFENLVNGYRDLIEKKFIKLIRSEKNLGVVGARKLGAELASGEWLLPIDSDNELLPKMRRNFESVIEDAVVPCILFRTVTTDGDLIGAQHLPAVISISDVFYCEYPELFGVYQRSLFLEFFCSDLLVKLRRFESIGFYRMMKIHGPFATSELILRKYHFHSPDRLSTRSGALRDGNLMARGHFELIYQFYKYMPYSLIIKKLFAIAYYKMASVLSSFCAMK